MQYQNDESEISYCDFKNGEYGVSSWANDIKIEACTFRNMSIAGIRGIGSSIEVEGNGDYTKKDFINCDFGIRLSWPNGQENSTDIYNNYFENNRYDVYVTGGSGIIAEQKTNFVRNQSDISSVSFTGRGENQFLISRNTFNSSVFCNFIGNSGEEDNLINLNEYNNSYIADVLFDKNLSTLLNANCYNKQTDADVFLSGKIPNQGDGNTAPGNCFSGNDIPEIKTGYVLENFRYYVPENNILECQPCNLVNSIGSFQVETSSGVIDNGDCGVTFAPPTSSPNGPPGHSPCNPNKNEADLYQAIADLEELLDEINNNELFSEETKENLIQYYERCLRKIKLWLAEVLVETDKRADALILLRMDPSFTMQIKGYNLLMSQNDYTAADTYLNSLNTLTPDQLAFSFAQNIYLDHLIDKTYTPSGNQISTLYQYGTDDNVLSGSIRVIYEYFTDEFIELDMTIDGQNHAAPRSSKAVNEKVEANIYPNPVTKGQILNIDLLHELEDNNYLIVTMFDLDGKTALHQKIVMQVNHVDTSSLPSGIYVVRITDQKGNTLTLKKVVVL